MNTDELREVCCVNDPVARGEHKHKCPAEKCGMVWKHRESRVQFATDEDFRTAHTCPRCGTSQTWKWPMMGPESVLDS